MKQSFDALLHCGDGTITIMELDEFCKSNNMSIDFKWRNYKRGDITFRFFG